MSENETENEHDRWNRLYNFKMPIDIEEQLIAFGKECFEPHNPVMSWRCEKHDIVEEVRKTSPGGKYMLDTLDASPAMKECKERHFRLIRDMITRFIPFAADDEELIDQMTRRVMMETEKSYQITDYDMTNVLRHCIRNYMSQHPMVIPIMDSLLSSSRGWYRRAQEGGAGDEDMMAAVKEGLEQYRLEPDKNRIESAVNKCGVSLNQAEEEWIYGKVKEGSNRGGGPDDPGRLNEGQIRLYSMAILMARWSSMHPGEVLSQMSTSGDFGKWAFEVYHVLAMNGTVRDSSTFAAVREMYSKAITPVEGQFAAAMVAGLLATEMKYRGMA